ncbi:MAG: tetratricopeptide repeat protein [Acidobacteria bacterium]|nr:tetratricopeptide repeat protein [Acidobacteriota bacterium]
MKSEERTAAGTSLQRLVLRIPSVAPSGEVIATVDYKLTVKENTPLNTLSPTESLFLPLSFWYPTPNSWFFVKGADTAPVSIKVGAASRSQVVTAGTSSGGSINSSINGEPFFVAGDWDVIEQNGVSVYVPKGSVGEPQKRAAELASLFADAKSFMSGVLGDAPSVPLRIVASRRGAGFADDGTVIVDEAVFRRSKLDSLTVMNIAEAAAKLWLGGSIRVTGDGHGIIGEGLARYLATEFIESKFGKDVADVERLRERNSYASVSGRDVPMVQVTPAEDVYFQIVANKGAMVWRILAKRVGMSEFSAAIKANSTDGNLSVAELRQAFSEQKDLIDYFFDKTTDMDLMAGLPRQEGGDWHVALRNTGATDATVDVAVTTADGQRMVAPTSIKASSFGDVAFKTPGKVVRAEVDVDKLYPQTDYSDDIAPHESSESDPLLAAQRAFDKQDFAGAENAARTLLRDRPRSDELRVILARALLAQGKIPDAQREFQAVLDEKLPAARSIAWANAGLADIAAHSGQSDAAARYAQAAIVSEGEYGASLSARATRQKLGVSSVDPSVKAFFADFDKAAAANRKADVESMVVSGEMSRFVNGVAGSAQAWQTTVRNVDRLDANTVFVEADMNIRLINKEAEADTAVYRLVKVGSAWKLAGVEVFETH